MSERDPRVDPRPGDAAGHREYPKRTVVNRFTDACGQEWVEYSIMKQVTLKAWKRAMRGADCSLGKR